MEALFDSTLAATAKALQEQDASAALSRVRRFFKDHQEAIKVYFDNKTLEETAAEVHKRLEQMRSLCAPLAASKAADVTTFMSAFEAFLQEEYHFRAEEMQDKQCEQASRCAA